MAQQLPKKFIWIKPDIQDFLSCEFTETENEP